MPFRISRACVREVPRYAGPVAPPFLTGWSCHRLPMRRIADMIAVFPCGAPDH